MKIPKKHIFQRKYQKNYFANSSGGKTVWERQYPPDFSTAMDAGAPLTRNSKAATMLGPIDLYVTVKAH